MALAGSERAYLAARSGIERSAAVRSGAFWPYNVLLLVDGVAREFVKGSLRVGLRTNGQPSEATFTVADTYGWTPQANQAVAIALGAAGNTQFGGSIASMVSRYEEGHVWYDVRCVDWTQRLNRKLVTASWVNQDISDIVIDLIEQFTHGFTTERVQPSLGITSFSAFQEEPASALRRLAQLVPGGGYWYVDADKRIHFFGASGEGTIPAPSEINSSQDTALSVRPEVDATQVRNRVYVEGRRARCPIPISATSFPSLSGSGDFEIPVDNWEPFPTQAGAQATILVAAGGGGGGASGNGRGGGGGGGLLPLSITLSPGDYTVVVGPGGAIGANGGNSSFGGAVAIGGGRGGNGGQSGATGGSGGGAGAGSGGPGNGTSGQGYAGGYGSDSECADCCDVNTGGGGGGAAGAGDSGEGSYPACSADDAGDGGNGALSSISGTATYYCGGGGGSSQFGTDGDDGLGGGTSGIGGGGAAGQPGGNGRVIVRYLTGVISATGGTITTDGAYTVHTFSTVGVHTLTVSDTSVVLNLRVGTDRVTSSGMAFQPDFTNANSRVAADAAIGATSIQVDATTGANGWARVGDQYIYHSGVATGPIRLTGIPASGSGSITAAITSGSQISYLPVLKGITAGAFGSDQPKDSDVIVYVQVDDEESQATMATLENDGGDGVHEYLLDVPDATIDQCTALGHSELAKFANTLKSATWTTRDLAAVPGAPQPFALPVLSESLPITDVEIQFDETSAPPLRHVTASSAKLSRTSDLLILQRE